MEDRPVARFLTPVITAYIRELQDKGTVGEGPNMLLPDSEVLDREWSQDDRQSTATVVVVSAVQRGCDSPHTQLILTCMNITRVRNRARGTGNKRLFQNGRTLPDTDVVVFPGRVYKYETVTPGRGFVRAISDSCGRWSSIVESRSRLVSEGLATCTALDHAWTITSTTWEHLKSGWMGAPEELIREVKLDCDRQVVLENRGHRSSTWRTLRALQKVLGAEEIWGCTCVTAPPFFSQIGPPAGRSSDATATGKSMDTDKLVVIIWDGLNGEERESAMSWMTTSESWVLWKQHDSWSTTKNSKDVVEGQLQLLLRERGWSLTGKEGKTKAGSKKNRRRTNSGTNRASGGECREETQNEAWKGGSVGQKKWWHSGQVKLTASDASEGNGSMGADFIVLENPTATGSHG